VQLETVDSDSQRRIAFDRSQASAVLFSRVSYKFLEGKVVVTASNLMYPKARALMALRTKPNDANPLDDGNVIYRRTFTFTRRGVTRDNVRESLGEGLSNVAWQLAADLNHMGAGSTASLLAPLPYAPVGNTPPPTTASLAVAQQLVARDNIPVRQNPDGSPARGATATQRKPQQQQQQQPAAPAVAEPVAAHGGKLDDVASVPYLTERGREGYRNWLTRPLPRAFAVSADGVWSATWGRVPLNPAMPIDTAERALVQCNAKSRSQCRLYAVDGEVVWKD
jgi:hypothetical protein